MSYQRLNPQIVVGTPVLQSGVSHDSDTRFGTQLIKVGSIAIILGALQLTGSGAHFSSTYTNVLTLPEGFRPTTRLMVPAVCGNSIWNAAGYSKVQLEPGGNVSVYCSATQTDLNRVQFFAVFTV